jgi:hypothetical protein
MQPLPVLVQYRYRTSAVPFWNCTSIPLQALHLLQKNYIHIICCETLSYSKVDATLFSPGERTVFVLFVDGCIVSKSLILKTHNKLLIGQKPKKKLLTTVNFVLVRVRIYKLVKKTSKQPHIISTKRAAFVSIA